MPRALAGFASQVTVATAASARHAMVDIGTDDSMFYSRISSARLTTVDAAFHMSGTVQQQKYCPAALHNCSTRCIARCRRSQSDEGTIKVQVRIYDDLCEQHLLMRGWYIGWAEAWCHFSTTLNSTEQQLVSLCTVEPCLRPNYAAHMHNSNACQHKHLAPSRTAELSCLIIQPPPSKLALSCLTSTAASLGSMRL